MWPNHFGTSPGNHVGPMKTASARSESVSPKGAARSRSTVASGRTFPGAVGTQYVASTSAPSKGMAP